MANPVQKQVESRVQNRSGCTERIVARFRAHLGNGHMMEHVWQDAHTDASTRNKQKDQCQTTGRLESRFGTTGNRVLNVCTRTKINRNNVSTMGQIHKGRLAAGEKSLRKAPPCMHCCQLCRQSRSRRVLSRIANLIWVVQGSCGCAPDVSWSA